MPVCMFVVSCRAPSATGSALRVLGGDGLEAALRAATDPLPPQQKALLHDMLKLLPASRKSADQLKQAGALTGNVRRTRQPEARLAPFCRQSLTVRR